MLRPESSAPRTLIADDQPDVLEALHLLLKREGYQIEAVNSPKAVLERLHNREYDVLLMDLNYALDTTSGQEGLDLLASVQKLDRTLPVVVMTAWGSIRLAVEAMQRGAADFVEKPWDNSKLLSTLRTQIEAGSERRNGVARIGRDRSSQRHPAWFVAPVDPRFSRLPDFGRLASGRRRQWRLPRPAAPRCRSPCLVCRRCHRQGCSRGAADVQRPRCRPRSRLRILPTGELCGRINRIVAANMGSGKFITFFYGVLDRAARRLRYTNAGHCEPILVRRNGECIRVNHGGVVLASSPIGAISSSTSISNRVIASSCSPTASPKSPMPIPKSSAKRA